MDKTTTKVGNDPYIPGKTRYLHSQLLSGNTVYKALTRFVEEECGMYIWFDNNNGKLEYGFLRNQVTIDPTKDVILTTNESSGYSEDFVPDNVQVVDNVGNPQCYPNPPVSGSTIQYRYSSDLNDQMMGEMAERIYKDLHIDDRKTYKVKFPAGTVKFKDGDVFTGLGDSTISPAMEYKDNVDYDPLTDPSDAVWQIKD